MGGLTQIIDYAYDVRRYGSLEEKYLCIISEILLK